MGNLRTASSCSSLTLSATTGPGLAFGTTSSRHKLKANKNPHTSHRVRWTFHNLHNRHYSRSCTRVCCHAPVIEALKVDKSADCHAPAEDLVLLAHLLLHDELADGLQRSRHGLPSDRDASSGHEATAALPSALPHHSALVCALANTHTSSDERTVGRCQSAASRHSK